MGNPQEIPWGSGTLVNIQVRINSQSPVTDFRGTTWREEFVKPQVSQMIIVFHLIETPSVCCVVIHFRGIVVGESNTLEGTKKLNKYSNTTAFAEGIRNNAVLFYY